MKNYKQLLSELPSKSVVFTVGRFNPPTLGHELSIKVVRKLAKQRKADHIIFVLTVQDAKKNPLEISKKLQYLELMFPNTRFVQVKDEEGLCKYVAKYKNAVMVTSSERAEYFKKKFKNNKLETFEVIPAGHKCPDSDDRIIKVAIKGNYLSFRSLLPTTVRELDGKRLMNDVRIGLDLEPIKEQINLVKDELREQYFRGEIFNEGDIVESDNQVYRIIKRGSNHLLLQTEEGLKVSKWIQDVQLTEREFMANIKEAVGTDSKVKFDLSAQREVKTAEMQAKHAKQKEDLQNRQKQEFDTMKKNMQTQQNEAAESPVVDKGSKYNIAKSLMSLNDFRKTMGMGVKGVDQKSMDDKETESDLDAVQHATGKASPESHIGGQHMDGGKDETTRRMRVKYHLGEEAEQIDELSNTTLQSYKDKAMKSADDLAAKGQYEKSTNRLMNHMKASGKQIDKTVSRIQAARLHREETEEQKDTCEAQLKRFKQQAADAKLTEAQYAGLEKESKPGKIKTAVVKSHPKAVESETVEGWEDEKKPVKEDLEFPEILDDEFTLQVQQDMDNLSEEDFYEAYDDEELAIIDEETGEEIESVSEETQFDSEVIMEVLSRIERIRAKARMRRTEAKRKRAEMIAVRRLSTPQVANKRARRMAISAMKKRLLKGRNPQKISIGEKERVERFIAQRKKIVDRLATRMVSRVKQVEKARMAHKKFTKPNNGVAF